MRWRTVAFTVGAIALVVAMLICVMALAQGLDEAFVTTGDPRNLIVLRKGSNAETNSTVSREYFNLVQYLPGVARGPSGLPLAARETVNIANVEKTGGGKSNGIFRGVQETSPALRPNWSLVEGRMFRTGLQELIVGNGAAGRFAGAVVGGTVRLNKTDWKIVGRFDANRSAFDSEFWGDVEALNREFTRDTYSAFLIQAAAGDVAALREQFEASQRLSTLAARPEPEYYEEQTKSAGPIRFLGGMISVIMSVGAVFAAMNTMYAAIGSRSWEIATLRVIGYPRRSILLCFMLESLLIGLVGGVLGCLLALPMNGVATGTTSMVSFAEVAFAFRVTPQLMLTGVVFAMVLGAVGGFLPALQASRQKIVESLREGT